MHVYFIDLKYIDYGKIRLIKKKIDVYMHSSVFSYCHFIFLGNNDALLIYIGSR